MNSAHGRYPGSRFPAPPVVAEFSDSDLDSGENVSSNAVLKSPSNLRIKVRKVYVLGKRVMPFFSLIAKFAAGIGLRPYWLQLLFMRTCNAIPDRANDFSLQCDDQNESYAYLLMTYGLSVGGVCSACNLLNLLATRVMNNVKGAARKLTAKKRHASEPYDALRFSGRYRFKAQDSKRSTKTRMVQNSRLPQATMTSADGLIKSPEDVVKKRFTSMTRDELEAEAKWLHNWCIKLEKCQDPEKVRQLDIEEMQNEFKLLEDKNACLFSSRRGWDQE